MPSSSNLLILDIVLKIPVNFGVISVMHGKVTKIDGGITFSTSVPKDCTIFKLLLLEIVYTWVVSEGDQLKIIVLSKAGGYLLSITRSYKIFKFLFRND